MGGNFNVHLDEFGICNCGNPSGRIEPMVLESQDDWGRWSYDTHPACADCFGLF